MSQFQLPDQSPVITRNEDLSLSISWPNGRGASFLVAPEIIEQLVGDVNRFHRLAKDVPPPDSGRTEWVDPETRRAARRARRAARRARRR